MEQEGVFSQVARYHMGAVAACFIGGCVGSTLRAMVYGVDDPKTQVAAIAVGALAYPVVLPYLAYVNLSDWWTGEKSTISIQRKIV